MDKSILKENNTNYRRANGQFATKEMAYADKQATDNKRLSFDVQKYKRMYLAVVKENVKLKLQLAKIKEIVK